MTWPQIIVAALLLLNTGIHVFLYGRRVAYPPSFGGCFHYPILGGLLWWGGFWS